MSDESCPFLSNPGFDALGEGMLPGTIGISTGALHVGQAADCPASFTLASIDRPHFGHRKSKLLAETLTLAPQLGQDVSWPTCFASASITWAQRSH